MDGIFRKRTASTIQLRAGDTVGCAVAAVFNHLHGDDISASVRHLSYHRSNYFVHVLRQPFARAKLDDISLVDGAPARFVNREKLIEQWVVAIEEAGMVEVYLYPILERLELSEVHDKSAFVQLGTAEGEGKAPVVSVDLRAMPIVAMLPVSKRYVGISLLAGEHSFLSL